MLAYLEHLISQEKAKVKTGNGDPKQLNDLLKCKNEYEEWISVLEKAVATGAGMKPPPLDERGVENPKQHLYSLKR